MPAMQTKSASSGYAAVHIWATGQAEPFNICCCMQLRMPASIQHTFLISRLATFSLPALVKSASYGSAALYAGQFKSGSAVA